MTKAIVIGAGLGGLSTAIRLAIQGYRVEVYEQGDTPGGKAGEMRLGGFRFDTGPSLLTMLPYFEELFTLAGERLEDYFTPIPLNPVCHYFFPDGNTLQTSPVPEELKAQLESNLGISPRETQRFLSYSQKIYEICAPLFLENSLHEVGALLKNLGLWGWLGVLRIDPLRRMSQGIGRFIKEPRGEQMFCRYATYNGSNPYKAPATLNLIPHVEYGNPSYGVGEGIFGVVQGLYKLAQKKGVNFHFQSPVEEILHRQGKVEGIMVGGDTIQAAMVVSNCDVSVTYRDLLKNTEHPLYRRYQKQEPSSSGFVFYWGINRSFSQLGVHNIFFSKDYPREFQQIFQEGSLPEDPTIYVNITSKITPEDAPPGGENWFVLINAPYDQGQDWESQGRALREGVLKRLSRELGCHLEDYIVQEDQWTPKQIQEKTSSFRGSLYGISSNSPMAAFLRHPNRSRSYKGLYFAGGSVHPGGGMPLALLSGKIVSDLVRKYES